MNAVRHFFYRFDLPFVTVVFVALALSACEMTSPSYVSTSPIEIRHDRYSETVPVDTVDQDFVRMIGEHYDRFGQGPVDVTVTYASGKAGGSAQKQANHIVDMLRRQGIDDVHASTLPVGDDTQINMAMINYNQVTAHAPRGCGPHPASTRDGLVSSEDGKFEDYRFGCGVDTYIAEQIVRPKELLGDATVDGASGERASTRLKDYRQGKDTKDLKAENASEAN